MIDSTLLKLMKKAVTWMLYGLSQLFSNRLGTWIAAAMSWLGLSWGSTSYILEPLFNQIESLFSDANGVALGWMGYLKIDIAITMILSAVAVRFSFQAARAFLQKS